MGRGGVRVLVAGGGGGELTWQVAEMAVRGGAELLAYWVTGLLAKSLALGVRGHYWPFSQLLAKNGRNCICDSLFTFKQLFIFISPKEDIGPDAEGDRIPREGKEDADEGGDGAGSCAAIVFSASHMPSADDHDDAADEDSEGQKELERDESRVIVRANVKGECQGDLHGKNHDGNRATDQL